MLRDTFCIALREWRELSRIARWTLVFGPMLLTAAVVGVYLHGTLSDLPMVVADCDHSAMSRQVIRMLDAHRFLKVVDSVPEPGQAFAAIRTHRAYIAAVIPDGFERDILRGDQGRVMVTHYGANMMIGKTVLKAVNEVIRQVCGERAAGGLMAMRGESAFTRSEFPPLDTAYHSLWNPSYNYLWLLPPGVIMTLWQMFLALWAINAGIRSLRTAGAERLLPAFLGRLIIPAAALTLHYLALFYLLNPLLGIPMRGGFIHGLVEWFVFSWAVMSLGYGAAMLTGAQLGASEIAMSLTAPAFVFSGYTYPFAQMPLFHRTFASLMPSTHYLPALTTWFYQGTSWRLWFPWNLWIYLAVVVALALGLTLWRTRREAVHA
jgi:ABC-2 type transport system permease protein